MNDSKTKTAKIALIGPPGSGKGTAAALLCDHFCAQHVSSGDVLRSEVARGTAFGKQIKHFMDKGEIGPVELITQLVLDFVDQKADTGVILDGFPRTVYQAEQLTKRHKLDAAVLIDVPESVIIDRITGRLTCPSCNTIFHQRNSPPKVSGKCDTCGDTVTRRDDDNEQTVVNRIKVYTEQTKPVLDYYEKAGLLKKANGAQTPASVHAQILSLSGLNI